MSFDHLKHHGRSVTLLVSEAGLVIDQFHKYTCSFERSNDKRLIRRTIISSCVRTETLYGTTNSSYKSDIEQFDRKQFNATVISRNPSDLHWCQRRYTVCLHLRKSAVEESTSVGVRSDIFSVESSHHDQSACLIVM